MLAAARAVTKPGGLMLFSTPNGAIEQGWLPDWDKVEYKGHVRAPTLADFKAWLEYAATGRRLTGGYAPIGKWTVTFSPDSLMLGAVTRG